MAEMAVVGGAPGEISPAVNRTTLKRSREDEGGVQAEKKWPGWPGDNVFRMIVPAQMVGAIIGRRGEFVKKMCDETRARIKILEGMPGSPERVVLVSAREEPDAVLSPAMDGILRLYKHIVGEGGGFEGDNTNALGSLPSIVSARLLVAATQAGSLIGKQGSTIKSIQDTSGSVVKILPAEDAPYCALSDDRIVEIQGENQKVQKALELIVGHLRKFLVDRTVLQLYELNKTMTNVQNLVPVSCSSTAGTNFPNSMQHGVGGTYTATMLPHENYFSNSDYHIDTPNNQGLPMYGSGPFSGGHSLSLLPALTIPVTPQESQVSQHIQIPLLYADSIIGTSGGNINYARQASGAIIIIQGTSTTPGEMIIQIHGTAIQVQTAQQIIQNFIEGSFGAHDTTYNTTNNEYNSLSYVDQNSQNASMITSTNNNHLGVTYGSSYSANYAY